LINALQHRCCIMRHCSTSSRNPCMWLVEIASRGGQ